MGSHVKLLDKLLRINHFINIRGRMCVCMCIGGIYDCRTRNRLYKSEVSVKLENLATPLCYHNANRNELDKVKNNGGISRVLERDCVRYMRVHPPLLVIYSV